MVVAMSKEPPARPDPTDEATETAAHGHVVALGASAGGVEALTRVVRELPPAFVAPILVVVHIPATAVSRLPAILTRAGPLPAGHAQHGQVPEPGRIYVAPPDRHLVVDEGRLVLLEGPHENGVRPAIDPLFRSVASWYRHRTIGAVLSGTLDDGTAGLAAIRAKGGVTAAQDPSEAIAPGMPTSAIDTIGVDYVLPAAGLAALFARFAAGGVRPATYRSASSDALSRPSDLVCPECGGVLRQFVENGLTRFHCRVGHTYSPDALYAAQHYRLEAGLWAAIRALEESASMARRLGAAARDRGSTLTARRFEDREREAAERAGVVRSALLALTPLDEMPPVSEPPPLAAEADEREAEAVG
jgi:two-component system chemotaxis response regulator CheB